MGMRTGLVVAALAAATAGAGEPFLIANEHPVGRLFGPPAGDDAVIAEPAGWRTRLALDIANTSDTETEGADVLILDGESWTLRLDARHRWTNGWHAGVQIPVISHHGGGTDDFIEWYHKALGLPQGNRRKRPSGQLNYRYQTGGETAFALTEPATGLGDLRFAVGVPVWRAAAGTRVVEAVAGLEVPTGDPDRLLGSGSFDGSLGLAAADRATLARWNLELHGGIGLLAMTPGDILPEHQQPLAVYGNLAIGWKLASWLTLRIQADGHSPFFEETGMGVLDRWAAALVTGVTVRLPAGFELDLAVAEDIVVNTAPDVVFHGCLKRSL